MDFLLVHDHKVINCLNELDVHKAETVHALQHARNGKRKFDGMHTKLECIRRYQSHLETLSKGFENTTCQLDGGAAFVEDVMQLELNMKWVLQHGWEHVFEIVEYPRLQLQ